VSALKEREINARDEPAMERKIEPPDSGTKAPRPDGNLVACRSVLGQSVLRHLPLRQDGLSAEIVFQHFVETAKSGEKIYVK
jgi:hypothetical protein